MNSEFPITIAYDMTLKKPGCALLQASFSGTIGNFELQLFGTENWLLAPTDNIELYTLNSQEELDAAIEITKKENGKK